MLTRPRRLALSLLALVLVVGCAPHRTSSTSDEPQRDGHALEGMASWYGPGFQGRRTASGETYDSRDLTCAHRTLAFGTKVLVRNLDNGRTCWVRVNDRGPFVAGRVVDLSYSAAEALGVVGPGTARVRLVMGDAEPELGPGTVEPVASAAVAPVSSEPPAELPVPEPQDDGLLPWSVQVGAFAYADNAEKLALDLARRGIDAKVAVEGTLARVRVGGFGEGDAERFAEGLRRDGYEAIVVRAR